MQDAETPLRQALVQLLDLFGDAPIAELRRAFMAEDSDEVAILTGSPWPEIARALRKALQVAQLESVPQSTTLSSSGILVTEVPH